MSVEMYGGGRGLRRPMGRPAASTPVGRRRQTWLQDAGRFVPSVYFASEPCNGKVAVAANLPRWPMTPEQKPDELNLTEAQRPPATSARANRLTPRFRGAASRLLAHFKEIQTSAAHGIDNPVREIAQLPARLYRSPMNLLLFGDAGRTAADRPWGVTPVATSRWMNQQTGVACYFVREPAAAGALLAACNAVFSPDAEAARAYDASWQSRPFMVGRSCEGRPPRGCRPIPHRGGGGRHGARIVLANRRCGPGSGGRGSWPNRRHASSQRSAGDAGQGTATGTAGAIAAAGCGVDAGGGGGLLSGRLACRPGDASDDGPAAVAEMAVRGKPLAEHAVLGAEPAGADDAGVQMGADSRTSLPPGRRPAHLGIVPSPYRRGVARSWPSRKTIVAAMRHVGTPELMIEPSAVPVAALLFHARKCRLRSQDRRAKSDAKAGPRAGRRIARLHRRHSVRRQSRLDRPWRCRSTASMR